MSTAVEPKLVDLDSERWLLQSMLLNEEANDIAFAMLRDDDISDDRHRIVWRHQKRLRDAGKPLDVNLLLASMRDAKSAAGVSDFDKAGGFGYLAKLVEEAVIPFHAKYYAERVRKASVFRKLNDAATGIARSVAESTLDDDIEELISRSEQAILDVNDQAATFEASRKTFKESVFETLELIQRRCKSGGGDGLKTGLTELDKITGGLRPGELAVLAARPGCGKSALAMNIAYNMTSKDDALVVFVSLEMSSLELTERLLGSTAKVMLCHLRSGTVSHGDRQELIETAGRIANCKLFIDDSPARTVSQIGSFCRMVRRKHKQLTCIIVDYIQLVTPENLRDPRQEQVAKISRRLKTLARELKVPILCLAQLNRQADEPTKPPRLSQLRESGAIEQDADIVLFIHRPNANATDGAGDCEDAEIHVAKQRNGPTGIVNVKWFRKWCKFENAAEPWQERKDAVFDAYNRGEEF